MIAGSTVRGTPHELSADTVYARQLALPGDVCVAFVSALIDGQGSGGGVMQIYPGVFDSEHFLTSGDGSVVAAGDPPQWLSWRLNVEGARIPGDGWIGFSAAGADLSARVYGVDPGTATAVTLPGGLGLDPPTGTPVTLEAALYAEVFEPYTKPDISDLRLARLPWSVAQRFLTTAPLSATRQSASAGWYGPQTDPEQGANAIVRSDGPLVDLVGQRLRVTARMGGVERAVSVFVHDEDDFGPDAADEDVALSRRAFMALAPLATTALPVEVAVLA